MSLTKCLVPVALAAFLCATVWMIPARAQGGRGAQAVNLPEGNGKALVEASCAGCHNLNFIPNSGGYTRAGWEHLVSTMVAQPSPVLLDYLATHFPDSGARPRAVLIPGNVQVSFKDWIVPSLGSRPHDPLEAPDGTLWWTGQFANVLGRVDPATGELKEYRLRTPRSGPHGLIADKDGNIWYTGNYNGTVGRLDPRTGEVTEYKMPDPAARDPHTPIFDRKGHLWFSLQNSNMMGRLIPETGEVKLITMPTPASRPYGVVINSLGEPFIVLFGTNKVAKIDPATLAVREYLLPNAETRPRRIAVTSDDAIWYADYSRGYLGRLDPKTGAVKEWPSPGGPRSEPYGIAAIGNIVWYSESAVRPNTLVRFDPASEKFQTWVIPAGGGVVRHMVRTRAGGLVLAESALNRITLVDVKDATPATR